MSEMLLGCMPPYPSSPLHAMLEMLVQPVCLPLLPLCSIVHSHSSVVFLRPCCIRMGLGRSGQACYPDHDTACPGAARHCCCQTIVPAQALSDSVAARQLCLPWCSRHRRMHGCCHSLLLPGKYAFPGAAYPGAAKHGCLSGRCLTLVLPNTGACLDAA
eukprot:1157479-Pelagomonas_calceolata.AAC.9